jgi:hypothetical protein
MADSRELRSTLERRAARLAGRRLVRVRYYELRYDDGQPGYRRGPVDQLDFGLELDVEPAATFHLTWEDQLGVPCLSLGPGPIESLLDAAVWDVTAGGGWAALVGERIVAVEVLWAEGNLEGEAISYPRAAVVKFAAGQCVYAVTAQLDEATDQLMSPYDGLVVFFGQELARTYGIEWPRQG